MALKLTRRGFGLLSLGAACLPVVGFASTRGFAQPGLLEEPEELMQRLDLTDDGRPRYEAEGMILVDTRPIDAFRVGHIPGARHLDPNAVASTQSPVEGALKPLSEIEAILAALGLSSETRVVFYDDRGGFHAARMFWLMEYLGHRDVALLNGGWTAWQALQGPQSVEALPYTATAFHGAPSPRRLSTADYILAQQGDPSTVVVDVRPGALYTEGHIPWAKNIPWSQNLDASKAFKPADALQAHFESHGVTPNNNVVLHCQNGLASAHSYVALRLLGYPRVRVYHRSWAEWGADPSLPKAIG